LIHKTVAKQQENGEHSILHYKSWLHSPGH